MVKQRKSQSIGRKLSHKGKQGKRGEPLYYDELKKRMNIVITPTARQILETWAKEEHCSISEWIERLARGELRTQPRTLAEPTSKRQPPAETGIKERLETLEQEIAALKSRLT